MARIVYLFKGKFPWDGRLIKICKSLQKAGHKVLVVARWKGESKQVENCYGLETYRACYRVPFIFSVPYPNNYFWIRSLRSIFEDFKPDVVIVREFFLVKAVRIALKHSKASIIIDMAENYPAAMKEWRKYKLNPLFRFLIHNVKLIDFWEKLSVEIADYIITVCEEQRERLSEQYCFSHNKIQIIYNVPELEFFANVNRQQNPKPRIFLHNGYHTSEKPIDKFLEYFIEFGNTDEGFRFIIAGPGDCIPKLQSLANSRRAPNVVFWGEYKFEELPIILQKADLGVIPYPANDFNNYTLHNKIFDYFACGIPVLVSDARPLKKLVEETNAGVSIQIEKSKVQNFFKHIDEYDWVSMSQNALFWSKEKYNWSKEEKKLLEFISKIIYG